MVTKQGVVIVLLIILLAGHGYVFIFNKGIPVEELNTAELRTGDVLFCYNNPIYERWRTGEPTLHYLLASLLIRNIGILKEHHPYFHMTVAVRDGDRSLLCDFTNTECFDVIKKKMVTGPMIVDAKVLDSYDGIVYLFRYRGPEIKFDLSDLANNIDQRQLRIPENHLDVILCHCLKLKKKKYGDGSCPDMAEIVLNYLGFNNEITLMANSSDILSIIRPTHDYNPVILSNVCHKQIYSNS